jgi:hypothetical protein
MKCAERQEIYYTLSDDTAEDKKGAETASLLSYRADFGYAERAR